MSEKRYRVMLSSTFLDLEEHRKTFQEALRKHDLDYVVMEDNVLSVTNDVIGASIDMVNAADAYLCLVGQRYGEPIECSDRNPDKLSTTELEFEQAIKRNLPIASVLFSDHFPVARVNMDVEPEKLAKLCALRDKLGEHRVVGYVSNEAELLDRAHIAASELKEELRTIDARKYVAEEKKREPAVLQSTPPSSTTQTLDVESIPPAPPVLHLVTPLSQGMSFVGRERELDELDAWGRSSDSMMVVEAIGGMGKSMLTYYWLNHHAEKILPNLAGRFWYSFYEEGASMKDFCIQALAYIEHKPIVAFKSLSQHDARQNLLQHLREKPWLLVLDGLERVLIAYGRFDAAQMTDEEADLSRQDEKDGYLCIRPDDDELLRYLAGVGASKILISTRNLPTALRLAGGGALRTGVIHQNLTGLSGDDAELAIRNAGVSGDGSKIRSYLDRNFDGHPLIVGVIAGIIMDHPPAPGNFDHWLEDEQGAKALNLATLDGLVAKRNHVLKVAFTGLAMDERKLLARLAFFSSGVNYGVLKVLNPRLPFKPKEIEEPEIYSWMDEDRKKELNEKYETYLESLKVWEADISKVGRDAETWLRKALLKLQRCGLLICDKQTASYDLHPLVRGFVRHRLNDSDRAETGTQMADYAQQQAPKVLDDTSSEADVDAYLEVARLLLLGEQFRSAADLLGKSFFQYISKFGRIRMYFELLSNFFNNDYTAPVDPTPPEKIGILSNQTSLSAFRLGMDEFAINSNLL
jgi:hypothetical protein